MFGCFYTTGLGPTDVYALSVWLHAKWHNVDSTCSHVPLVCLGVFFTEVDYAHFPCCSSLWCIIHLIQLIMKPCLMYLITDLRRVWFHFVGELLLGISFEVESLFSECTLQNSAGGGGDSVLVTTKDKHDINTQSRCKWFTAQRKECAFH